jgi:hypothetical protein
MTAEEPRLDEMAANRAPRERAKAPRGEFEAFTTEDLALLYVRQARTAVVTIAVLAVVWVIATITIGVVVMIGISHVNNALNQLSHENSVLNQLLRIIAARGR